MSVSCPRGVFSVCKRVLGFVWNSMKVTIGNNDCWDVRPLVGTEEVRFVLKLRRNLPMILRRI